MPLRLFAARGLLVRQGALRDLLVHIDRARHQWLPFGIFVREGFYVLGVLKHLVKKRQVLVVQHFAAIDLRLECQGAREPLGLEALDERQYDSGIL
jgi:hypothetical protein